MSGIFIICNKTPYIIYYNLCISLCQSFFLLYPYILLTIFVCDVMIIKMFNKALKHTLKAEVKKCLKNYFQISNQTVLCI